ncbi:hypothetical protein A2U01_0065843, partial [Trifolium medium]|nr:hypothetical protein [Trifolium medium]
MAKINAAQITADTTAAEDPDWKTLIPLLF